MASSASVRLAITAAANINSRAAGSRAPATIDPNGRWTRRWSTRGGSFYVTFWPSEFNQVRGQYRRTKYGDGVTANEFLFQLNFSIGAHGAHVF